MLMSKNETERMDMSKVMFIDPMTVKVNEDLPRIRKDLGEVQKMLDSIKNFGQIQPIVINQNMELLAGGRRLAACIIGSIPVMAIYKDAVDPILMRELELEENLQRKALTPAEEVLAVQELHELKQRIHGVAVSGKKDSGWRLDDTAAILGKDTSSIIKDIALAEAIKNFPELAEAKTKSEITKAVKGLVKVAQKVEALKTYEEQLSQRTDRYILLNVDSSRHMASMPDNSVDLLLTDPPYGIEIDKISTGVGNITGNTLSTTGLSYADSREEALPLLELLAKESFRFVKPTGFAYVFCGPEWFWLLRKMFISAGWNVHVKPIIWIKHPSGQCNMPAYWPSSCYEMVMFARKTDSRLVVEGQPDWIQCNPVPESLRLHPAEKPVQLIENLINRTSLPAQLGYDPFMGSGSTVETMFKHMMKSIGCEKTLEIYATACDRMIKVDKQ